MYQQIRVKEDYLKYWRVIRYWASSKYDLKYADLDMLIFLYSEGYFKRSQFNEFNEVMPWDRDRFEKLMKDGWIVKFRDKKEGSTNLYKLTNKSRGIIKAIYRKCNGEAISEDTSPLFHGKCSYTDKVYRNYIKQLNKETKKLRLRPSPE